MEWRLALYDWVIAHRLDADGERALRRVAGLEREPAGLARWLPRGVAVLAAALGALGLVFWIAANWESLGRFGRFALLQGVVLVMCAGALWRPAARTPLALMALAAIGGLFAYFGQTYQTGADPWQLFALWAVLALPLCLGARSDAVWTPWAVVAMTAISLWVHAHTGHRWRVEPQDLKVHALGWLSGLLLVLALGAAARRFTGAGVWSLRCALTLWVVMLGASALGGLFHSPVAPHYALGLVVLGLAAATLASPRFAEVYGLSAVALGLDTLLVAGLGRLLFDNAAGDPIGRLTMIGLAAAGLLAATVTAVLRVARRIDAAEAAR
ncbi:MAG TPA: DUF2157 domain-containing protein [Albitalea sp.]|nr:DUF2157 domain-containing protein [Albitalea sp.]